MRRSRKHFALLGCCVLPLAAGCGASMSSPVAPSTIQARMTQSTTTVSSNANGEKPERFPFPSSPQTFPAGQACSFALKINPIVDKVTKKVYPPQPNGDFLQAINGNLVEQLTNLNNGKSITLNLSGPATILGHPNGILDETGRGISLVVLLPFDVPPGPSTFVVKGRVEELFNSNTGVRTLVSETGTKTDICAALS